MKKEVQLPKLPFPVADRAAFIRKAAVALEVVNVPTAKVVCYDLAYDRVVVANIVLESISDDPNTRGQYYVDGGHTGSGPKGLAKTHLSWLRSRALESGATPEAIRLLTKATGAFTKKEEAQMAEKLKSKASAKANTSELKKAAKSAPVGGKGTSPKRGNLEALAKARAARTAGPDDRKIKALKKPKDIAAREGTFRHHMISDALAAKTVQDWKDVGDKAGRKYDAGCLRFLTENGYISVPDKK